MSTRELKLGAYGGFAGGLVFGAMMGFTGMLPMIGSMVGQPTAGAGFVVHMVNSVIIGAGFALVLGRFVSGTHSGVGLGLAYGGAWWILGPLTLMPLFMGMGLGVNWNAAAAAAMLPSLVGHLMFGGVLGLVYAWLRHRNVGLALATAG
ncbi:MAG: hypothetical protein IIB36_01735 [Gemmatimonadetes bacterium]|nr:hypothetical protein [Gemmatimonadota bacterium]